MSEKDAPLDCYLDLQADCFKLISLYQAQQPRKAKKKVPTLEADQADVRAEFALQLIRLVAAIPDAVANDVPEEVVNRLLIRTLPTPLLKEVNDQIEQELTR